MIIAKLNQFWYNHFANLDKHGGHSSTVEHWFVAPVTWVQFPVVAQKRKTSRGGL